MTHEDLARPPQAKLSYLSEPDKYQAICSFGAKDVSFSNDTAEEALERAFAHHEQWLVQGDVDPVLEPYQALKRPPNFNIQKKLCNNKTTYKVTCSFASPIKSFTNDTPEEAVDRAWAFHNKWLLQQTKENSTKDATSNPGTVGGDARPLSAQDTVASTSRSTAPTAAPPATPNTDPTADSIVAQTATTAVAPAAAKSACHCKHCDFYSGPDLKRKAKAEINGKPLKCLRPIKK